MLFDPATAHQLKPWLVRTLEPICDAEPGALADYILALLKHNAPENDMRKELAAQLDEFLEKECATFIDTLFTVLRTKSYLPYAASPPSLPYASLNPSDVDTGIPIPLDGLISPSIPPSTDRIRKRNSDNDDRDLRPPAKGPRISGEGQFTRYSNSSNGSTGGWGGGRGDRHDRQDVNGHVLMDAMNGSFSISPLNGRQPQNYRPPDQKRGICRDYYNNGYCARGAFCKYSHGDDAVVPSQIFSMAGAPMPGSLAFMPMFPNGFPMGVAAGAAYDPHEAQMDMTSHVGGIGSGPRSHTRAPLLSRIQGEDGNQVTPIRAPGELPVIQDLTPEPPPSGALVHPDASDGFVSSNDGLIGSTHPMSVQVHPLRSIAGNMDMDVTMSVSQPMNGASQNPGRGGRGRGRGRGHFTGDAHGFHGERRNDKTLVVEKIPEDKLSLDAVNGWFKKFGTVTNVAVDASNAKALVSFSKHEEAYAAWKSEDAIFNNRFVKIFWHRPMNGHGQAGARMLAASAPLVASMVAKDNTITSATPVQPVQSTAPPIPQAQRPSIPSSSSSALAAKQLLLEQQIVEQKSLMAKLSTATPDEKKQIMARLRKLGEEMKPSAGTVALTIVSPAEKSVSSTSAARPDDHEQKERERLDKELEMHNATSATESDAGKSTEDLKAKLEKLKVEAARLGISDTTGESTYTGGSYRPYRGRGRGSRGYYRGMGRGSAPRGSMKLDNRPRTLLVKGVGPSNVQVVRDWYETTGQVDSLETLPTGDIIVMFKTRNAAEQGLSKGNNIPPVGKVSISWYHGPQAGAPQPTTSTPERYDFVEGRDAPTPRSPPPEGPVSPRSQDEEVVTSGWGGDADDGDGMGML